ncbi:MAG TPA: hypothetical protein VFM31_01220 [Nitrososphaeraceae archaeon]|nr:hypothetical protein [Nitrososphaeraceae archaeon]
MAFSQDYRIHFSTTFTNEPEMKYSALSEIDYNNNEKNEIQIKVNNP